MNQEQKTNCPICKSINSIFTDNLTGQILCHECGEVYEEGIISEQNEAKHFKDDNGHCPNQRVSLQNHFETECGTTLAKKDNGKIKLIKSFSKRTKTQRYFYKINKLLSAAQVQPNEIEETKIIFDNMVKNTKNKNLQGRNINLIIIGIYYYVCRKLSNGKSIKQIYSMFKGTILNRISKLNTIKKPKFTKKIIKKKNNYERRLGERTILKVYNKIKYYIEKTKDIKRELVDQETNYIRIFVDENNLNWKLKELSNNIVENINKNGLLDKTQKTISGLALIISCKLLDEKIQNPKEFYTQFSKKYTIKKSFETIKDDLNLIIPKEHSSKIDILLKDNIFP